MSAEIPSKLSWRKSRRLNGPRYQGRVCTRRKGKGKEGGILYEEIFLYWGINMGECKKIGRPGGDRNRSPAWEKSAMPYNFRNEVRS